MKPVAKKPARPGREPVRANTKLARWIDRTGMDEVAKLFAVHRTNVGHWRAGRNLPRPAQMYIIYVYTKGKLTPSSIICEHYAQGGPGHKLPKKKAPVLTVANVAEITAA